MNELAGLGRLYAPDERDKKFLLPRRAEAARTVTSKVWWVPKPLDQGNTSQCVAYSGTMWLLAAPIKNKPFDTPKALYDECQAVDEWKDQPHDGSSVRALFKIFQKHGVVDKYLWAPDVETVVEHLLTTGPVVMGTNWYRDMFTPDKTGFLEPAGPIDGGHAWCVIGANRKKRCYDGSLGAVRMINSWGDKWGEKGRAWVSFKDLDRLIKEDGEAGVGTEVLA